MTFTTPPPGRPTDDVTLPGSDAQVARDLADLATPNSAHTTGSILVQTTQVRLDDATHAPVLAATGASLEHAGHVTSVRSPSAAAASLSADGRTGWFALGLDVGRRGSSPCSHGAGGVQLTGLSGPVPIESYVPLMLFALLFGLSMDYEVFLLSAVQRSWRVTGDNRRSVREGIASTGAVITAAATIMVSVFAGFVLDDDPAIKMFGLGLAVAVAVDATVVRGLLAPATMALMGAVTWWTPTRRAPTPRPRRPGAGRRARLVPRRLRTGQREARDG